jgi:parallel beta-helix repeat protein
MTYTRPALGDPGNSGPTSAVTIIDALSDGLEAIEAGPFVYASSYGVRMNGAHAMLCTTSGSSTITSQLAPGYYGADFKASDVGATIRLNSGCFSQAVVTRTIATVAPGGNGITVSGGTIPFTSNLAIAEWSHDTDAQITANTTAMQTCIDAAQGRVILLEPGTAIFDAGFVLPEGARFKGAGVSHRMKAPPSSSSQGTFTTCLMLKRGVDATLFYAGVDANGVTFEDLMTWGTTNPSTTNWNTYIQGPSDGYTVNTLFRNARMYGGWRVLRAENTSIGVVQGGIFGNGRIGGVHLVNSPDWAFMNADVHQYTNWEHTGSPPGATGYGYEFDTWSGGNVMIGSYVEFGEFGVVCNSKGNTFIGCRFSDSRDTGLVLSGDDNTATGNVFYAAGGDWGGYTTGARSGIWVGGSYNSIANNTFWDVAAHMQKSVRFYTTATNNKMVAGAARYAHEDLGTGNVVI